MIEQVYGFAEMEQQMRRVIGAEKEHLNSSTPDKGNSFPATIETLKELIIELDFTEMLPAIEKYQATYQTASNQYKLLIKKEVLLVNLLPTIEHESISASKYITENILPQAIATSKRSTLNTRLTLLFSAIATASVIILLLLWTAKSINLGLVETIKVLGKVAEGNFAYSITSPSHKNDEFSRLIDSVNNMAKNL
ncbi:MAG: methyl-accepting chemotaxis protein [Cognaticolwellia sp.]